MKWEKGQSGNPAGRRRSAITDLRQGFIDAWTQLGIRIQRKQGKPKSPRTALRDFIRVTTIQTLPKDPGSILRIAASFVPREVSVTVTAQTFHAELVAMAEGMDRVTMPSVNRLELPAPGDNGDDGDDGNNGGNGDRIPGET
jgi:hypothetical protein